MTLIKWLKKLKKAGGKIVNQKQTIPGVGDTIYATDTEGKPIRYVTASAKS
jgi:predicted enzyme related to lactoylglutathione lyase